MNEIGAGDLNEVCIRFVPKYLCGQAHVHYLFSECTCECVSMQNKADIGLVLSVAD